MKGKEYYVLESDVYSFGNLLFEIIHGKKIWGKFTVSQCCEETLKGNRDVYIY